MTDTVASAEKGLVEIDATTLHRRLVAGRAVLVDVREEWEFADERIPGAINLPLSTFDIGDLPAEDGRLLVLACAIGRRSAQAAGILLAAGYDHVAQLRDGMLAWDSAGYEMMSDEPAAVAETAIQSCASA